MPRYTTTTMRADTLRTPLNLVAIATVRADEDDAPRFPYAPQVWDRPAQARRQLHQDLVTPEVRQRAEAFYASLRKGW